jgi:hypothetical protein
MTNISSAHELCKQISYNNYLQQSFFLTKIALNTFQKNCPIDFTMVITALLLT